MIICEKQIYYKIAFPRRTYTILLVNETQKFFQKVLGSPRFARPDFLKKLLRFVTCLKRYFVVCRYDIVVYDEKK